MLSSRERREKASVDALHDLWKLIDDKMLVRDISRDGEGRHFVKTGIRIVTALKKVEQVLRNEGRI